MNGECAPQICLIQPGRQSPKLPRVKPGPPHADVWLDMGKPKNKPSMFDTTLKLRAFAGFPVFNFFKGCQNTSRPDWGVDVLSFKLPGNAKRPARDKAKARPLDFRKT
jgi:hypothetical protein